MVAVVDGGGLETAVFQTGPGPGPRIRFELVQRDRAQDRQVLCGVIWGPRDFYTVYRASGL